MKKILIFLCLIILNLQAVKIKIEPDNNLSISKLEIDITIKNFLKRYIKISKEDAKKYIHDNRILSDQFIKKYTVPQKLLIEIRLDVEKKLADLFVKKNQEKIKINQEVLESYYKTHPKECMKEGKIEFIAYKFSNFQKALKFYTSNGKEKIEKKIKVTLFKRQINPVILSLFDKTKAGEFTPPTFYNKEYVVFKIIKREPAKRLTLQECKTKIRNILLQKIFRQTKQKLIQRYQ